MFHSKRKIAGHCLCLLLALATAESPAQSISGRPLKIFSGDRLLLMSEDNTPQRIALAGIAAPPPDSRWGAAAKRHLGTLVLGRVIRVELMRREQQGPDLPAKVLLGGADVNLRLIQAGLARHVPNGQTMAERALYAEAEQRARDARQGLWSQSTPAQRSHVRRVPGGPVPRLGR